MLRTLLIGGALLAAIPAFAQTAGTSGAAVPPPTTAPDATADSATLQSVATPQSAPMSAATGAAAKARHRSRAMKGTTAMSAAGTGGPYEPVGYPPCSHQLRDRCTQMGHHRNR